MKSAVEVPDEIKSGVEAEMRSGMEASTHLKCVVPVESAIEKQSAVEISDICDGSRK